MVRKVAVLTSGGDAPGMNAALRAVVRAAIYRDWNVVGIRRGYAGLLEEDYLPLFRRSVGGIIHRGGTMLRTARSPEFKELIHQKHALDFLERIHVDGLIVIGGDGSLQGAASLAAQGLPTVTIPATIDNDMAGTEDTIGFDTAVNTIVHAVNAIRDTAFSHERIAVIEVMGRSRGHLALTAAAACGAEAVLVPELPVSMDALVERLQTCRYNGKHDGIVIVAEGAAKGADVAQAISERTAFEPSVTVLGYIQRGGAPSAHDSILASRLGAAAVTALEGNDTAHLIASRAQNIVAVPYAELSQTKRELDMELYQLVHELSM